MGFSIEVEELAVVKMGKVTKRDLHLARQRLIIMLFCRGITILIDFLA